MTLRARARNTVAPCRRTSTVPSASHVAFPEDAPAPPGPRVYTRKDNWRTWPPRSTDPSSWQGFVGNWYCDLHDPAALVQLQTLRTWRPRDAERNVWDQANVYSLERLGTSPRDWDGLHQKLWEYPVDRATFGSPVDTSTNGMLITIDHAALGNIGSFRLPPISSGVAPPPPPPPSAAAAAAAAGMAGGATPGGTTVPQGPSATPGGRTVPQGGGAAAAAPRGPSPVWGFELFLHDGDCRWSLVLLYSTITGAITKVTFVQEYDTTADPATENVLSLAASNGTIRPPREPLDCTDPASWVKSPATTTTTTHGSGGRVVARIWAGEPAPAPAAAPGGGGGGAGARVLMAEEGLAEPVAWGPVNTVGELLLVPLPDSMYLRGPASLKDLKQQAEAAAGEDKGKAVVAFEFGGLMRSTAGGLQRMVVRYDAGSGAFVDATREVFGPAAAV